MQRRFLHSEISDFFGGSEKWGGDWANHGFGSKEGADIFVSDIPQSSNGSEHFWWNILKNMFRFFEHAERVCILSKLKMHRLPISGHFVTDFPVYGKKKHVLDGGGPDWKPCVQTCERKLLCDQILRGGCRGGPGGGCSSRANLHGN